MYTDVHWNIYYNDKIRDSLNRRSVSLFEMTYWRPKMSYDKMIPCVDKNKTILKQVL